MDASFWINWSLSLPRQKRKREELSSSKNNKKQWLLHHQITSRFALELLVRPHAIRCSGTRQKCESKDLFSTTELSPFVTISARP